MLTCMMGNCEVLISMICGSLAEEGSSTLARSTFSRTRCNASVMSMPASNSTLMLENPSREVEEMVFTSAMVFSSSSSGLVTSVSMSPGATPPYTVLTMMLGITISGIDSRGTRR